MQINSDGEEIRYNEIAKKDYEREIYERCDKEDRGVNASVKCIPVPGIANAYVIISGHSATTGNGVKKCMSFFYDNGDVGAEWEPDDGPITVIHSCGKDAKNAQRHWFYDYCTGYGEWGQLAVEEEGLPRAFILGDYEYLFAVLKNWAK